MSAGPRCSMFVSTTVTIGTQHFTGALTPREHEKWVHEILTPITHCDGVHLWWTLQNRNAQITTLWSNYDLYINSQFIIYNEPWNICEDCHMLYRLIGDERFTIKIERKHYLRVWDDIDIYERTHLTSIRYIWCNRTFLSEFQLSWYYIYINA